MIQGVGVDLISIERIVKLHQRFPDKFLKRIFSERELDSFLNQKFSASSLAARFAAKEAVLKAIGCGIGPIALKDVEIITPPGKQPRVKLLGDAQRLARSKNISAIAVSLTHEPPFASAIAAAYSESDRSDKN